MGAILPEITYGNDFKKVHRVNGTMINEGKLAAEFLTKQGYKKFVVIHDTTDYGKGQFKYFSEYLKPTGGEILATFPVSPDQQDFALEAVTGCGHCMWVKISVEPSEVVAVSCPLIPLDDRLPLRV